jgi:hypothetical protein
MIGGLDRFSPKANDTPSEVHSESQGGREATPKVGREVRRTSGERKKYTNSDYPVDPDVWGRVNMDWQSPRCKRLPAGDLSNGSGNNRSFSIDSAGTPSGRKRNDAGRSVTESQTVTLCAKDLTAASRNPGCQGDIIGDNEFSAVQEVEGDDSLEQQRDGKDLSGSG